VEPELPKFTPISVELDNDSTIGVHIMGWQIANLYEHETELEGLCTYTYLEDGELGRFFVGDFRPTTNIEDAMLVLNKLREQGESVTITDIGEFWDVAYHMGDTIHPICAHGKSLPEVICRAALLVFQDRADRAKPV